jgi:hypothetical protein
MSLLKRPPRALFLLFFAADASALLDLWRPRQKQKKRSISGALQKKENSRQRHWAE